MAGDSLRRNTLRVLLAEDGPVNQKVAAGFLKLRGHEVVIVNNGRQAIETLQRQKFDVVLMDVQMPEMDGIEATVAIREQERSTGAHLPIIAMTANAMKSDRERCLAMGMDDYISKPIDPERLYQKIERISRPFALRPLPIIPEIDIGPAKDGQVFDCDSALTRFQNNGEMLREIAAMLLDQCPILLSQIRRAIANRDGVTLERAAHTLKGSANVFGAPHVVRAAARLERIGRDGSFENADDALADLHFEAVRLLAALADGEWLTTGSETCNSEGADVCHAF